MATPITTGSTLDQYSQYSQYAKPINEIIYSKQQWQQGAQSGSKGLQDWAANNAQQYYNMLPTELAAQLKAMDLGQAQNFYKSLTGTPQPQQQAQANPFDQQISDVLSKLGGTQQTNPFDQQLQALLAQLTGMINQTPVDPASTPEYAAAQARVGQQMADAGRQAQESLGASGFARSTNLTDRIQQIGEQGADYLNTQVLPAIAQQLQQVQQAKIQNQMGLLNLVGDQQKVFDERANQELQRLATMYEALTGQQGVHDTRQQNAFDNSIKQGSLNLEQQKFQYQKQYDGIQQQNKLIDQALQRTMALGYVTGNDAGILGVKAGTQSFEAANAAAQRKQQLEMQSRELGAQMARLDKQLAAEKTMNDARIAADKSNTSVNALLAVWQASGKAPSGLEQFGVAPGTAWTPSAGEQLQQLQLNQALQDQTAQQRLQQMAPKYQTQYGLDPNTAQALISVMDNPTYQSALSDLKAHDAKLRASGVDVSALRKALESEMNPTDKQIEAAWKALPTTEKQGVPFGDWRMWYRDPNGRLSGLSFVEWTSLGYGPQIKAR